MSTQDRTQLGGATSTLLAVLVARARAWSARVTEAGWIGRDDAERLAAVETAAPADLFARGGARPLVVALFGGTGVGKSSLLNRLAGEPIARVGVERPTSREVTVYVHESIRLADLPPELPVASVQVRPHRAPELRSLLWIDMPDIDSAREENRRLALAWLPYVDLVVYVVSPERYRDDAGWRVLLDRGDRHGWLFVMNRWDEGRVAQRDDFVAVLARAGFERPLLLCTSCAAGDAHAAPHAPPGREDEFPLIRRHIDDLLAERAVEELERLGVRARLEALRSELLRAAARLGDDPRWDAAAAAWSRLWARTRAALRTSAECTARHVAGRAAAVGPPADDALGEALWDDWCAAAAAGAIDAFEVDLARAALATEPMRRALTDSAAESRTSIVAAVAPRLREALARPGGALRRAARRATGFLTVLLPALALAWVGYVVVARFHQATAGSAAFLDLSFATHAALLVLVAWAAPYAIDRLLKPSVEESARRAIELGVSEGLEHLERRLADAVAQQRAIAERLRGEAAAIARDIHEACAAPPPRTGALARTLAQ